MFTIFLIYLAVINLVAFAMFHIDKKQAKYHARRIPESVLLFVAFIGGSFGARMGMSVFRHKTKKEKFTIGVTLMLFLHLLAIGAWWTFFID